MLSRSSARARGPVAALRSCAGPLPPPPLLAPPSVCASDSPFVRVARRPRRTPLPCPVRSLHPRLPFRLRARLPGLGCTSPAGKGNPARRATGGGKGGGCGRGAARRTEGTEVGGRGRRVATTPRVEVRGQGATRRVEVRGPGGCAVHRGASR